MKKIAKAVITTENRYEHGDIVRILCKTGYHIAVVAKGTDDGFIAFVPELQQYVMQQHDSPLVEYVGRVTKTNVIGK